MTQHCYVLWCLLYLWKLKVYTYIPFFKNLFIHNQLGQKNYSNAFRWHKWIVLQFRTIAHPSPTQELMLSWNNCSTKHFHSLTPASSCQSLRPLTHTPISTGLSQTSPQYWPALLFPQDCLKHVSNTTTILNHTCIATGLSQIPPQYWPVLLFPQDCLKHHHNTDLYSYFHTTVSNTTTILTCTPIFTGLSQTPPQCWPVPLFPQNCLKHYHNTDPYYFHRIVSNMTVSNTTTILNHTPIATGLSQIPPQYWPVLLFPQDSLKYHHNTDLYSYFHTTVSNTTTILTCTPISTGLSQYHHNTDLYSYFHTTVSNTTTILICTISTGLSQPPPQYWPSLYFHRIISNTTTILNHTPISTGLSQTPPHTPDVLNCKQKLQFTGPTSLSSPRPEHTLLNYQRWKKNCISSLVFRKQPEGFSVR